MTDHSTTTRLAALAGFLVVTFAVAFFGTQFTPGAWYDILVKPSWTPPGWIFPPVWTTLYAAMAFAAWLVWRNTPAAMASPALIAFAVQLVFNGLWSWLFFGEHRIGLALIDIILLLAAIVITTVLFFRRHKLAGWLMVPYIAWVTFATALNFRIWTLN